MDQIVKTVEAGKEKAADIIVAVPRGWKRVFLSYGHDEHRQLAELIYKDLTTGGFEVWFDGDLVTGSDYERDIEAAIDWVSEIPGDGCILLLMTPHSVRRPDGYCLNELSRALDRSLKVIPIMVVQVEPPLSICRIQWLDMQDCIPVEERKQKYELKIKKLVDLLARRKLETDGMHARLLRRLEPISFDADVQHHLPRFTGRQWVFDRLDKWIADPRGSKVFWLCGGPGVGKTAIASWLSCNRKEIAAFHMCRHGHQVKADPRRCIMSIAYQLSTQIPEYEAKLSAMNLEGSLEGADARTLFDTLIVQPLSGDFGAQDRTYVVLIDALDEAASDGRNELASFIATEFSKTPSWLRLIVTSRPEPLIKFYLQGFAPYVLQADSPENLEDIRSYLSRELKPFYPATDVPVSVIDFIVRRSEGIFLYVEEIIKELGQKHLSLDRLDEFPRGLGGIYVNFFERQFPDKAAYQARIMPALEVICASQEPLEVGMLASVFGWEEGDLKRFQAALGSLFPEAGRTIKPFHKSVVEWLTEYDRAYDYYVSMSRGHARLSDYGWKLFIDKKRPLPRYIVSHLNMHLLKAGRLDDLLVLMTDLGYLEEKCTAGLMYELIKDFRVTILHEGFTAEQQSRLKEFARFVSANSNALAVNPRLIYQQAMNGPDATPLAQKAVALMDGAGPWLRWVNKPQSGSVCMATLFGHMNSLNSCAYSPDGTMIAAAGNSGRIKVWDALTGKELITLPGHKYWVRHCTFSPDGLLLAAASVDGTVKLWDVNVWRERASIVASSGPALCCAFSPDGQHLLTASMDKTLKLQNLSGKEIVTLRGHNDWVNGCAFSPDGKLALSASSDRTLKLWDLATGEAVRTFAGHEDNVTACAFSRDGSSILSASWDKTLKLWDVGGSERKTFSGHNGVVSCCAFSPDGSRAVSASSDGTLKLWEMDSGREINTYHGHTDRVDGCAFSPDGTSIASASIDKTVKLWDATSTESGTAIKNKWGRINKCLFTPDGSKLIAATRDGTLIIMDGATGQEMSLIKAHDLWASFCDISPDGNRMLSTSNTESLKIWSLADGKESFVMGLNQGEPNLTIWNILTGYPIVKVDEKIVNAVDTYLPDYRETIGDAIFSPDGSKIYVIYMINTILVLDVVTGDQIDIIRPPLTRLRCLACSPDGTTLAIGTLGSQLMLMDLASKSVLWTGTQHKGSIISCAYSRDGRKISTASADHSLRVWDAMTGAMLQTIDGHKGHVRCSTFSPDGRLLLSASQDRWVKVWDAGTGKVVVQYLAQDVLYTAAWSPDGRTIAAGDGSGNVYLLKLENLPGRP